MATDGGTNEPAPDVFVSHARADEYTQTEVLPELENQLKGALGNDYSVFVDKRSIQSNDRWDRSIQHAVEGCRAAILLVSPPFVRSAYVDERELPTLYERYAAHDCDIYLLHVRETATDGNRFLRNRQFFNDEPLNGMSPSTFDKTLKALCQQVRRKLESTVDQHPGPPGTTTESAPYQSRSTHPLRRASLGLDPVRRWQLAAAIVLLFASAVAALVTFRSGGDDSAAGKSSPSFALVPEVADLSADAAGEALTDRGFTDVRLDRECLPTETGAEFGIAFGTRPSSGVTHPIDQPIELRVTDGTAVYVPTFRTEAEAQAAGAEIQQDPDEVLGIVVEQSAQGWICATFEPVMVTVGSRALRWTQEEDPFVCDGIHLTERVMGRVVGFDPNATVKVNRLNAENIINPNLEDTADDGGVVTYRDDCDPSRADDPYQISMRQADGNQHSITFEPRFAKPPVVLQAGATETLDGGVVPCEGQLGEVIVRGFNRTESVHVEGRFAEPRTMSRETVDGAISFDLGSFRGHRPCTGDSPGGGAVVVITGESSGQRAEFLVAS